MNTIKIKETSKSGVLAHINGVFGQIRNSEFHPYSEIELQKKSAYKDNTGWVEYESIEEWVSLTRKFNEERKNQRLEVESRMKDIIKNTDNYDALDIWQSAVWLNKQNSGWSGADLVLADNKLSKKLLEKLGTYTVTPFDDGTLMIKSGNKRYGNKRGWLDVESLLA